MQTDNENNEAQPATSVEAAIDAGIGLATLEDRRGEVLGLPVALIPNGMSLKLLKQEIDLADERAPAPRRLKGTATLTELASFIAHVNRHKSGDSVVFADTNAVRLTAVLNYNEPGAGDDKARWRDHRSVYTCPLSEPWRFWNAAAGKKFKQEEFAQLIEERMDDLASPTGNGADKDLPMPSEVLTMARHLVIRNAGQYSRTINPQTGESTLIAKMEHGPESTKIPRAFLLKLQVFEAGAFYAVEARIRFELGNVPVFSFFLYRAEQIKQDAFSEVRTMVEQQTSLLLLAGAPE